jgi:hypothetical protein
MPPTRTVCPACSTALRLKVDLPAGKQIKCPKCGTAFLPAPAAEAIAADAPRPRSSRPDDSDEPRRPRRGRRPQEKSNTGLIVLGAIAGALVLAVGIVATIVVVWARDRKPDAVAAAPTPTAPSITPTSAPTTILPDRPILPEPIKPTKPDVPPDRTAPEPPTATVSIPPTPPDATVKEPAKPTAPSKPTKPKFSGKEGLEIGDLAMEINGTDIDGKKFKLSDYRGKVVVLDFWGNW